MSRMQHSDFATPAATVAAAPTPPARISSEALMRNGRLLEIEHRGQIYTLRLTRQDKLLLTK